jgi:hypothetical protein
MADKVQTTDIKPPVPAAAEGAAPAAGAPPAGPRRGPGHRGADVRDTVAEMTEKAQQLSLEAGSKVAGAMKDVIYAAAGITGFAIESARDLVQYMVRRGQMRAEEADKIMREVEEAHAKKKPGSPPPRPAEPPRIATPAPAPQYVPPKPQSTMPTTAPIPARPASKTPAAPAKPAAKVAQNAKPAAKSAPAAKGKSPAKAASKPVAKAGAKKAAKKR